MKNLTFHFITSQRQGFQIDEIVRVDRKNDEHTISNKTFDFSSETIKLLLEQGYNDAHDEFNEYIRNQLMKTTEE